MPAGSPPPRFGARHHPRSFTPRIPRCSRDEVIVGLLLFLGNTIWAQAAPITVGASDCPPGDVGTRVTSGRRASQKRSGLILASASKKLCKYGESIDTAIFCGRDGRLRAIRYADREYGELDEIELEPYRPSPICPGSKGLSHCHGRGRLRVESARPVARS